ncbi:uncharacterized protein B0H18DRAFT_1005790 [Fomitopsis serialis]|uniref:uncharacterized protein n=1 Tax=Fomitopsis serialis TaxID=139415 RepID=UPI002008772B|nr:uncharacterized protein B0H18DRAFT_1005790 [Neoantrodia serialis]KAH9926379.1 hypothetical protein B0H18DRAFT_1005790 [Neoantrodia serialis]
MTVSTESDRKKLGGYEFYREVLGSPKYVVAPMVDQSELAWRRLSRRYGAQLVYTPMINAKMYADPRHQLKRESFFNTITGEEGGPEDRPLIVQFCTNDPDQLLTSAKLLEPYCDAVDINLGCPQDIARRGHYGSYLQDDWDLIYSLINTLHHNLSVPVTAKFRVFPSVEKTQRGHSSGLADWDKIRAVKEAVSVPVFANGNVLFYSDVDRLLAATGADAVMSAEGNLYNPALFSPAPQRPLTEACSTASTSSATSTSSSSSASGLPLSAYLTGAHPRSTSLALEYLEIVKTQRTPTPLQSVKGHLFKLLRPALAHETDLRERLHRVRHVKPDLATWEKYEEIVEELDERMQRDEKMVEGQPLEALVTVDSVTGLPILPHWLAQPYIRPPPIPSNVKAHIRTAEATVGKRSPPGNDGPLGSGSNKRAKLNDELPAERSSKKWLP